ncbi:GH92 family glycosyl hydrolase [Haliscomenobacter hydrossis]|uniref:Alpha-1,2-mannosidase n=1 Tax=Haliscomenobacter hydrossis (strain ATCC 27775 / DSM 1100 / LMG 10767 / O) TaxID=760192 RepID=F4KQM0_HALH1|nr:GH92 family glycosyl hydrolase [Haliscomenobacter hydrossis]AEE50993.1 alpha-1,2-mannosidase [Haliscomenobacter hydrossis DSM 1100]
MKRFFPLTVSLFFLIGYSFQNQVVFSQKAPVDLVYPLIDAANSRWFFFNSASRPFGMVNLSPDNAINADWGAGYRYNLDSIKCFSHIHCWQLSGIPVMPTTGAFKGHLGANEYGSKFSHDKETIKVGYHKVVLDAYNITAELTSTTRVGFHQYTFPQSAQSHILFDFSTFLGPSDTEKGQVKKVSNQEIEGYAVMAPTTRRPKTVTVFFVAVFDKPFDTFKGWRNGKLEEIGDRIEGARTGAYLSFTTQTGEVRKMKVAISYVSEEQARLNLNTELPHWDFNKTMQDSRTEWNQWLSRIEIEGGSEKERSRFYTDLWHALLGRRIINDVNGKYCDMTGPQRRIGQIPLDAQGKPKYNHHNSDSFWGAQWTINTLWHLVYPEVTESFVNSMVMMYQDGGLIPRGPAGGNYTYVMTGAATTPFIVSAYLKGIRGFDIEKAYEGLRKNHFPGGMMSKAGYEHNTFKGGGIEYYIERGYVPHPLSQTRYGFHQDGSTQTLEYAYQDFGLAQMAKKLGKMEDYTLFMKRAENYKNIWNPEIGWMWNRTLDGKWGEPVDILTYDHGWEEGTAAQYVWFVPHDVQGLIKLMGSRETFTSRLNESFEKAQTHDFVSGKSHDKETLDQFRRVYINYGNQPSIQTAFLFNYSGAPWLTQYWSRQVVEKVYSDLTPQLGYSGDEDQGLMGSLAVLMKTGLFSVNGGTSDKPFYEISSPIFNKITLHLNPKFYPGGKFVIAAKNNGPQNYYIQSATLNGKALNQSWLLHETLVKGGKMTLQLGPKPNKSWASKPEQAPPSMTAK